MPESVAAFKLTSTDPNYRQRRARFYDITANPDALAAAVEEYDIEKWEKIDLLYRSLVAIMFSCVPQSGHPGGSVSSGRIVLSLLLNTMAYDFTAPDRPDNDLISYAAGHKATGLYAAWALRNELIRIGDPSLLTADENRQLRLEDLLGFRRNPTNETPLFKKFNAKPLDGHPTPQVPFIKHATGPSGVGDPAAFGLAAGALDIYPNDPPRVNVLEGEGGMTAGRVHEALATAASSNIWNLCLHVDFNQASIDSDKVCADDHGPGDYVQWDPRELTLFHDWNTIDVPNGFDFRQILAAQKAVRTLDNGQPTAIIYHTVKGWRYGIEGAKSHGAGHKFASEEYHKSLADLESTFGVRVPRFEGEKTRARIEQFYYDTLMTIRKILENNPDLTEFAARRVATAREAVDTRKRKPHAKAPHLDTLYTDKSIDPAKPPESLQYKPGDAVTLRAALGTTLGELNRSTGGAFIAAAADLAGSTSISSANKHFPQGFYNAKTNPESRLHAVGGICEDAMGAFMSGISSFESHIGVSSSYGAFIAAMEHVPARAHAIGQQMKELSTGRPYNTWMLVCAHAGAKTGEDGPTHADPQPLQLLQECFPGKTMITLTPWDAREMWPMVVTALRHRPAVLAPFVTRPADTIVDREALRLPPAISAAKGVYALRTADPTAKQYNGTLVLQGNAVATIFMQEVLPRLDKAGFNFNVYYVASVELFNLLPQEERDRIFPEKLAFESMGITDFTLPTLYRWVRSDDGLRRTLHPFRGGHFLGSGAAAKVLEEAGIHADGQWKAISEYAQAFEKRG